MIVLTTLHGCFGPCPEAESGWSLEATPLSCGRIAFTTQAFRSTSCTVPWIFTWLTYVNRINTYWYCIDTVSILYWYCIDADVSPWYFLISKDLCSKCCVTLIGTCLFVCLVAEVLWGMLAFISTCWGGDWWRTNFFMLLSLHELWDCSLTLQNWTTKPSSTSVHLVILLCKLLSEDLLGNALTRSDSIYNGSNAQNLKLELHDSRASQSYQSLLWLYNSCIQ